MPRSSASALTNRTDRTADGKTSDAIRTLDAKVKPSDMRSNQSNTRSGEKAGRPDTAATPQVDTRNFAIGILSVTATILLTGLLVIGTRPAPVLADGMSVTGGDYVMLVGAYEEVDEEFVYLIDAPTERIIVYRFNAGRSQIEIVQGIDFGQIRKTAGKKQPGRP